MLTDPVRREVSQVDPDLALFNFRVMDDFVADSVAPERFSLDLLSAFGATGFALAIIGLYGVLSHSVSLRMKEIGVRMALGARSADVLRLVMARGISLILAGLAIGLLGASGLSRFIESQLYQVSPVDWTVYSAVAMLVLVVSLAACYLPARRASRIDPNRTLHLEG
jgi:putative ABC transport system permease protein